MSFEGNYYEACKRIVELQAELVSTRAAKIREFYPLAEAKADALRKIQQWDCLNPPRSDLLADLPWLKRLVDEALGDSQSESVEPAHPLETPGASFHD